MLEAKDKAALDEFLALLRQGLGTELVDVRLFGSAARGRADPESDIDLLVVVRTPSRQVQSLVLDTAYEVSLKYDLVLSPLVFGQAELNAPLFQQTDFYAEAVRKGVPL